MRNKEVIHWLESQVPTRLAESWDHVGWQLGDQEEAARGILWALEADERSIAVAQHHNLNLIIVHHPLFFRPVTRLLQHSYPGKAAHLALRAGISIYAAHTNLDNVDQGSSWSFARAAGLTQLRLAPLRQTTEHCKVVVFVPEEGLEPVRSAMAAAGAGWIGNYSECSFAAPGIGTFLPQAGTHPYSGKPGRLERVREYRLETITSQANLSAVVQALCAAHPYEEVAYEVYPLVYPRQEHGALVLSDLPEPVLLRELAASLKMQMQLVAVRVLAPDRNQVVKRIAVCAGSGGDFIADALRADADLLLTGECRYHQGQEARRQGMALITVGHARSETPVLVEWAEKTGQWLAGREHGQLPVMVHTRCDDDGELW